MLIRKLSRPVEFSGNIIGQPLVTWPALAHLPFECAWYSIAPESSSTAHNHFEGEVFAIFEGAGRIIVNDETRAVEAGDFIILPPFSKHSLENTSLSQALRYLAVWWPIASPEGAATAAVPDRGVAKRLLVTASRVTPNGDLHVGHLSGPYIAADILARYSRLRGVPTAFVTGSDDHQTYVALRATNDGEDPERVASYYRARIERDLRDAGVEPDVFGKPHGDASHATFVQQFFDVLLANGAIVSRDVATPFCVACDRMLAEGFLRVRCGQCGEECSGDACDHCGFPVFGGPYRAAQCAVCKGPAELRTTSRFIFRLELFRDALAAFHENVTCSTRMRDLLSSVMSGELPDVTVSYDGTWGLPVPEGGTQRISAWLQVAAGFLAPRTVAEDGAGPSHGAWYGEEHTIVQFFGIDNAFFYGFLYPALLLAYAPRIRLARTYVTNEFYRVDTRRFSTSEKHGAAARELLDDVPADFIRFYLSLTRPEFEQTVFSRVEFLDYVNAEFAEMWRPWLVQLGERARAAYGSVSPAPGRWSGLQRAFFHSLTHALREAERALTPEAFSPQRYAATLSTIAHEAASFSSLEHRLRRSASAPVDADTSIALELAAARLIAGMAAPLMPNLSQELWHGLGHRSPLRWPSGAEFVPAGQPIGDLDLPVLSAASAFATPESSSAFSIA
jgi:methionyl-tRNA synthetase